MYPTLSMLALVFALCVPVGPWPDGPLRLVHDQEDGYDAKADGVRK